MEWTATLICGRCGHEATGSTFEADNREDALQVTLHCPNCETPGGLEVEESTLAPADP